MSRYENWFSVTLELCAVATFHLSAMACMTYCYASTKYKLENIIESWINFKSCRI
jgi:hypothetical protein